MRSCRRRFVILGAGGVRVAWACGAQQDFPDETAIDVDVLVDHLPQHHHHRHHLHRKE